MRQALMERNSCIRVQVSLHRRLAVKMTGQPMELAAKATVNGQFALLDLIYPETYVLLNQEVMFSLRDIRKPAHGLHS